MQVKIFYYLVQSSRLGRLSLIKYSVNIAIVPVLLSQKKSIFSQYDDVTIV